MWSFYKKNMASISSISGSVAILKIFYLNLEQSFIVGYQFWEIRKFLMNWEGFLKEKNTKKKKKFFNQDYT
jgi:hypothetical protein